MKNSLVLCVPLLFVFGLAQSQEPAPTRAITIQKPKTNVEGGKQHSQKDERGTEKMPLVIKSVPAERDKDEVEQRQRHHAEETAINRGIRDYTGLAALFSLLMVAVGSFQVWMFWRQLDLMKITTNAAEKSAAAAEKNAKAVIDAEAPYLLPDNFAASGFFTPEGIDLTGLRPRITYGFKNHGKSPAIIRRWRDFTLFTNGLPERPVFTESWAARSQQYIPVGAGEVGGDLYAQIPKDVTRDEVLDIANRRVGQQIRLSDRWLYVIGEVEYVDIFNVIRTQGYCLKVAVIYPGDPDEHGSVGQDRVYVWRDGGKEYNQRQEVA